MGLSNKTNTKTPPLAPEQKSGWIKSLQVPTVTVAFLGMIGVLFQQPILEYSKWMMSSGADEVVIAEPTVQGKTFVDFLKANETCTRTPGRMVETPSGVRIAALICDTGDIYLAFYYDELGKAKKIYGGIFLMDTIESGTDGIVVSNNTTSPVPSVSFATANSASMWGAAHASTSFGQTLESPKPKSPRKLDRVFAQQYLPIVQCQWFPDNNTIVRKVVEGNSCYIEVIDAQSGLVLDDYAIQCSEPCG